MADIINIESMVAAQSSKPFVRLSWGDEACQMTPDEARKHAYDILDAANAAESDSLVFRFFVERVKLPAENAILLFREFRTLREGQTPIVDGAHKFDGDKK
jgi:hypothetical protein